MLANTNAQGGVTVNPNRAVKFAEQIEGENNQVVAAHAQMSTGRVDQLRSSRKPGVPNVVNMNGRNPRHNSLETNVNPTQESA